MIGLHRSNNNSSHRRRRRIPEERFGTAKSLTGRINGNLCGMLLSTRGCSMSQFVEQARRLLDEMARLTVADKQNARRGEHS
jgi:hypothetical protein